MIVLNLYAVFLASFVASIAKGSFALRTGTIIPSTRSRHLLTKVGNSAPTETEAHNVLEISNLGNLDVSSIELQLHEDEPVRVFDNVMRDKETWYGEERDGQGFMHLVLRDGSNHLSGMIQDEYMSYGIWTHSDGTIFSTQEEQFQEKIEDTTVQASAHQENKGHTQKQKNKKRKLKKVKGDDSRLLQSGKGGKGNGGKGKGGKGKGGSKKTRVDIMVLYTNQAMCAHAGLPANCPTTKANREAIEAEAKLNVAISNVALQQSGINVELKLVHLDVDIFYNEVPTDTDDCSFREILQDDDEGNNCNAAATPSLIGTRNDIHQLRNKHGADIVGYFVDKNYNDYTGGNGMAGDTFGTDPDKAYFIMNRNSRFHFVFTHEMGHVFGVGHRNAHCNAWSNNAVDNTFVGPCFKTIMVSRGEPRCECVNPVASSSDFTDPNTGVQDRISRTMIVPRIPLFASPNVSWSGHNLQANLCTTAAGPSQCPPPWTCVPCPTGLSAAEIIENNAPTIAAFRSKPSKPIPLVFGLFGVAALAGSFFLLTKKRKIATTEKDGTTFCGRDVGIEVPYVNDNPKPKLVKNLLSTAKVTTI